MSKFCPILKETVTYLYCQECDDRICEKEKYKRLSAEQIEMFSRSDKISFAEEPLNDVTPLYFWDERNINN